MRIFINDVPVRVIKSKTFKKELEFEMDLNALENNLSNAQFFGNVIIRNVSEKQLRKILKILTNSPFAKLNSVTIVVDFELRVKEVVKSYYTFINAAGGIVEKGSKILMIHRLRKWDLPKGKVEKGESFMEAAMREVEEECNISVSPRKRICASYHTYSLGEKNILKKTVWYSMKCIEDTHMKPAKEENIDEIRWMNHKELLHSLLDSYRSLGYVMECYFRWKGQIG